MKKIFAVLFLCFCFEQSLAGGWLWDNVQEEIRAKEQAKQQEQKKVKDYKRFIGLSVGAGAGDLSSVPAFEPRFFKTIRDELLGNSLEFALAIEGGWQKYTHKKVGYQTMFRGRFLYMSDFSSPIFPAPIPSKFNEALSVEVSAGIDGIFDFVKNDKSSFGMILGINGGFNLLVPFQKDENYIRGAVNCGYGVFSNIRAGFQIGMPMGFIDLVAEASLLPVMLPKAIFNYTLSLGYKHFF